MCTALKFIEYGILKKCIRKRVMYLMHMLSNRPTMVLLLLLLPIFTH